MNLGQVTVQSIAAGIQTRLATSDALSSLVLYPVPTMQMHWYMLVTMLNVASWPAVGNPVHHYVCTYSYYMYSIRKKTNVIHDLTPWRTIAITILARFFPFFLCRKKRLPSLFACWHYMISSFIFCFFSQHLMSIFNPCQLIFFSNIINDFCLGENKFESY